MNMHFWGTELTDWISAIANSIMAVVALYAAFKVRNVIEERNDENVYSLTDNLLEQFDKRANEIKLYNFFFPFKLVEPVNEWNGNSSVKKKVEDYLSFSEKQLKETKEFIHTLKEFERKIQRFGWKIHKKALSSFSELICIAESQYFNLSEYNCLTAKLFEIDKQFFSTSMFLYEDLPWEERFKAIDKNLSSQISMVHENVIKIENYIAEINDLYGKNKFIAKA